MLVAAIVIGALTAYYFGLRAGGVAAGVSLFLFLVASAVPGAALPVYGLVASGIVGVCFIGPRRARPGDSGKLRRWSRRTLGKLVRRL